MENRKVLFIAKHKWPHIGGVEKHMTQIANRLQSTGHTLTIISEEDIKPPKIKYFGLLYIWYWLLKNRKLILQSDTIHIHDVFIWYFPFRFLYPTKKVYITFHGWEGKWPISKWAILNKRVANYLCDGSIAVGKYVEKSYGITATSIIYGGVSGKSQITNHKLHNSVVWLGRQDKDTGIEEFKKWLDNQKNKYKVKYITNELNSDKYLKTAEYCVPSGYLSFLEAKSYGCKIMTFANNPLKEDYWNEIKLLKTIPTWDEVVKVYLKLWK